MQIYEQLKQDHNKLREVMNEIEHTSDRAVKKRSDLLQELKELLLAHTKAEEVAFYRSMLDDIVTHERALEALEEHRLAESTLEDLEEVDPSDEKWLAKFHVLKESLEHHFDEEEKDLFKKARKIVSRDEAEEMGEVFVEMRAEVIEELRVH